ncbi:MAG: DUF3881 family protein [Lachnospiraceae bacterium]|nr:DUF3881 family protein [Lachnospiraceae bacterium]
MHTYMKAIGFSKKESQAELEALVKESVIQSDSVQKIAKPNGNIFVEYQKSYGENFGVIVRGEEDSNGTFHIGTYFPYLKSSFEEGVSEEEIFIHKKVDSDAYTGMCDDNHLGVSLIFYLQNIENNIKAGDIGVTVNNGKIKLTSLSSSGKIILPTQKRIYSHIASKIDNAVKNQMMDDAKNGDMEALDYLAMNDMDKNASLMERIKHEDLFSIVETTFIPYGSESDLYVVLGNIISSRQLQNKVTGELVWVMKIVCNDITFETVINSEDLMGFPSPGMRFKGIVWMQGELETVEKKP